MTPILQQCYTLGFPNLVRLGKDNGGFQKQEVSTRHRSSSHRNAEEKLKIATEGAELINVKKMTTTDAARILGISDVTMRTYCKAAGIVLTPTIKTSQPTAGPVIDEVIKLINDDGYRVVRAAEIAKTSTSAIMYALKKRGLKYNAKKIKIEGIKS